MGFNKYIFILFMVGYSYNSTVNALDICVRLKKVRDILLLSVKQPILKMLWVGTIYFLPTKMSHITVSDAVLVLSY